MNCIHRGSAARRFPGPADARVRSAAAAGRNPVRVRDGPATVTGERPRRQTSAGRPAGRGGAVIRESGDSGRPAGAPCPRYRRRPGRGPRIGDPVTRALVLISTADTDLLAARASGADWRVANPSRLDAGDVPAL